MSHQTKRRIGRTLFWVGAVICVCCVVAVFAGCATTGTGSATQPSVGTQVTSTIASVAGAIAAAQPGTPWGLIAGAISAAAVALGGLFVHNQAVTALANSTPATGTTTTSTTPSGTSTTQVVTPVTSSTPPTPKA